MISNQRLGLGTGVLTVLARRDAGARSGAQPTAQLRLRIPPPTRIRHGWSRAAFAPAASLTWEADVAREGIRNVRIANPTPNDAAWTETVTLELTTITCSQAGSEPRMSRTQRVNRCGRKSCLWVRGSTPLQLARMTGRTSGWCSTRDRRVP
jgi:hypothetical protein